MSERVPVARAADFEPGTREIVETDEGEIGVFNVDGEYYAVANVCAHEGGPVCEGQLRGALIGEYEGPGERVKERFSEDTPAIACPWHGWEYDLTTGEHLGDPTVSLQTFDVVVDDGTIYLDL
jgi:nitrite reductase/ring-hydroxylating ferredoxin subunit